MPFPSLSLFLTTLLAVAPLIESRIPDDGLTSQPSSFELRNELITSTFPPLDGSGTSTGNPSQAVFEELQMNLCNSGWANCYEDGKSVGSGSATIKNVSPNLVTVNEICSNDVIEHLHPTLAAVWPKDWTYSVFMPAIYKANNSVYHCTNGDYYGSALIGRGPLATWNGVRAYGGKYASQWGNTQEERIFACAATADHFACTTHLAAADDSTVKQTALAQCKALMFDVVPYLKGLSGSSGKTIVGGDFNLKYDKGNPDNVQNCVPNGYTRKGDGDVQHIIVSNDFTFTGTKEQHVDYTDHNAFLGHFSI